MIQDEQQLSGTLTYIHENPVKAGLVTQADDYRWSSASLLLRGMPGSVEGLVVSEYKKERDTSDRK